jgi:alkylation response protein AidB-like acyl-CoA dehydrogenase
MDVRLSPEQRQLRETAARVAERLGPGTVARIYDRERTASLEAAVAQSGWRELRGPDAEGRPFASAVAVAVVAEQLARGLADVSFLGPTLAAELRRAAAAPDAVGTETVALVPDLSALAVVGEPAVALDAFGEIDALVLVPTKGGWKLGSLPVRERGGGVDLTRPVAPVATRSARPVPGQRKTITRDDLESWTALGLATSCADLVGVMQGALDSSVEYAKGRRQYARTIGSFQAVQHMLADAAVSLEGSRSTTLHAAWAVDALEPGDALGYATAAKAYSARAGVAVCEAAIQVHGGIGNTWDCVAHLYLRRALLSSDVLGGVGPSLSRVLEHVGIVPRESTARRRVAAPRTATASRTTRSAGVGAPDRGEDGLR